MRFWLAVLYAVRLPYPRLRARVLPRLPFFAASESVDIDGLSLADLSAVVELPHSCPERTARAVQLLQTIVAAEARQHALGQQQAFKGRVFADLSEHASLCHRLCRLAESAHVPANGMVVSP